VLLVSHDRAFLDAVVTGTIVFEGDGRLREYVGGYSDWVRQRRADSSAGAAKSGAGKGGGRVEAAGKADPAGEPPRLNADAAPAVPAPGDRRRLSYKESRELAGLPERIEQLEAQQGALQALVSDPGFYQKEPAEISARLAELASLDEALQAAYARWEALEAAGS
jgi:ABC transport system ATP-binding/permease protein